VASTAEVVPVPPPHRAPYRPGPSHPSRRGQTISQKSSPFPWKEKNHGDDSATATTITITTTRLTGEFRAFPRHRATTTSVILSLPPAPPALYPSPPPTTPRSTVISRNVGYSGNLQTADHACSTASKEQTYAKSDNPIGSTDGSISAYRAR